MGAAILKRKKLISIGWNQDKTHTQSKTWANRHHAEFHALVGTSKIDLAGTTIFVARLDKKEELKISKPCPECRELIQAAGIRKVFYINEFGSWTCLKLK